MREPYVVEQLRKLLVELERRAATPSLPTANQIGWAAEQLGSVFPAWHIQFSLTQHPGGNPPMLAMTVWAGNAIPSSKSYEGAELSALVQQALAEVKPPRPVNEVVAAILPMGDEIMADGELAPF